MAYHTNRWSPLTHNASFLVRVNDQDETDKVCVEAVVDGLRVPDEQVQSEYLRIAQESRDLAREGGLSEERVQLEQTVADAQARLAEIDAESGG